MEELCHWRARGFCEAMRYIPFCVLVVAVWWSSIKITTPTTWTKADRIKCCWRFMTIKGQRKIGHTKCWKLKLYCKNRVTPVCREDLCRVYTYRFDNHVPKGKLLKKYFLVVKLAQYFVFKVDRKLASYCKQEIVILKLGKLFSQPP